MVNLSKGQKVNLSKEAAGLQNILVGLGWDVVSGDGKAFDLDAMAFILEGDVVKKDEDFIYFGNKTSQCGAIVLSEDNLTGAGEGDDESMTIDLSKVGEAVTKIAIIVDIHDGVNRGQNFGMVDNAFVRVVNSADEVELARFDLSFDASTGTSLLFGELIKRNGEWYFNAAGTEYTEGLAAICTRYGLTA